MFFHTLKASDGVMRDKLDEITEYLAWHINQVNKNTFISHF